MDWNDTGICRRGVPMNLERALSADEAAHTSQMHDLIAADIGVAGGWISFERYMDLALYAPGLGYYRTGTHKLGRGGDFTTAPEISSLFGACLGRQCAEVLREFEGASVLEVGAGSGRLAIDVLNRLETLGRLPCRYMILEISGELRARQQQLIGAELPHLIERVEWLDTPPSFFDGVVIANEVLDALPVAQFRWSPSHVDEIGVSLKDGSLVRTTRCASAAMKQRCDALIMAALECDPRAHPPQVWDGYESEFCPRLIPWAVEIARSLRRGAAFWVDYGLPRAQYYLAERHEGTLLCHYQQRAHDNALLYPGLQDITAWVDFTALAEAASSAGCELAGFTTQAHFLASLGVDVEMQRLAGDDATRYAQLAGQARRLMLPGEMGERFKVMAWLQNLELELSGFSLRDLRHTL